MTQEDARAYLNYLLTLHLRQEEAFGPLALAFVKENDLTQLCPPSRGTVQFVNGNGNGVFCRAQTLHHEIRIVAKSLPNFTSNTL